MMTEDGEVSREYQSDQLDDRIVNVGQSSLQALNWTWSGKRRPEVTWIGSPTHEKMALTHLAYGNETSQSTVYSYAAIIAEIPPFQERKGLVDA